MHLRRCFPFFTWPYLYTASELHDGHLKLIDSAVIIRPLANMPNCIECRLQSCDRNVKIRLHVYRANPMTINALDPSPRRPAARSETELLSAPFILRLFSYRQQFEVEPTLDEPGKTQQKNSQRRTYCYYSEFKLILKQV